MLVEGEKASWKKKSRYSYHGKSFLFKPIFCFKDRVEAMIMAEKNLYGGKKSKALTMIFKDRGIL